MRAEPMKAEITYGTEPGDDFKGQLVPPYKATFNVKPYAMSGIVDGHISCPHCKTGINVRFDFEVPV